MSLQADIMARIGTVLLLGGVIGLVGISLPSIVMLVGAALLLEAVLS